MTTTLANVCTITMGQAPSGSSYNDRAEGLPLIAGAGDFKGGVLAPTKFTTEPGKVSKPGDIVLSIRASIGAKVWADGEYCLGRGVAALRARPELDDKYLWHWLTRSERDLASKGRGATFLQVNKNDIGEMPIVVPPLDEQRRIAAILDQADALRAKRRQVLAHLDDLTRSIFLEMFGDPVRNERGWPLRAFGEVCETRLGKMLDAKQQTGAHPRPYLRNANVQWFRFDLDDVLEMDFDEKSRATHRLEEGDVLICEGGRPGRAAIWRNELEECYFQKALHRARPNPDLAYPEFLVHLLWFVVHRGGLKDHVTSATISHLTGAKLKAMPIILPSIEVQAEFVRRLAKVIERQTSAERALGALTDLTESLQSRAFRREL